MRLHRFFSLIVLVCAVTGAAHARDAATASFLGLFGTGAQTGSAMTNASCTAVTEGSLRVPAGSVGVNVRFAISPEAPAMCAPAGNIATDVVIRVTGPTTFDARWTSRAGIANAPSALAAGAYRISIASSCRNCVVSASVDLQQAAAGRVVPGPAPSAPPAGSAPASSQPQTLGQSDDSIMAAVIRGIGTYLEQLNGACFSKDISLGTLDLFQAAINDRVETIIVGQVGQDWLAANSPGAKSSHYTWRAGGTTADLIFPFDPRSPGLTMKNRQSMMHEMTHHIEFLNRVKEASTSLLGTRNPHSERNTQYQDEVVDALGKWKEIEDSIKSKEKTLMQGLSMWKDLENVLSEREAGSAAGGNRPDGNLESMTGFHARFDTIWETYLDGKCGDDFRALVLVAESVGRLNWNLEFEGPAQVTLGDTARLKAGTDVELKPELAATFHWKMPDARVRIGNPIDFTPTEAKPYEIQVELILPRGDRNYVIAQGSYKLEVTPKPTPATPAPTANPPAAPPPVPSTPPAGPAANSPATAPVPPSPAPAATAATGSAAGGTWVLASVSDETAPQGACPPNLLTERNYFDPDKKILKTEYTYYLELGVIGHNIRCGAEKKYFENGKLAYDGTRQDDRLDGKLTRYSNSGDVYDVTTFQNGSRHGPYVSYWSNKKLRSEGVFQDDRKVDPWSYYEFSGAPELQGAHYSLTLFGSEMVGSLECPVSMLPSNPEEGLYWQCGGNQVIDAAVLRAFKARTPSGTETDLENQVKALRKQYDDCRSRLDPTIRLTSNACDPIERQIPPLAVPISKEVAREFAEIRAKQYLAQKPAPRPKNSTPTGSVTISGNSASTSLEQAQGTNTSSTTWSDFPKSIAPGQAASIQLTVRAQIDGKSGAVSTIVDFPGTSGPSVRAQPGQATVWDGLPGALFASGAQPGATRTVRVHHQGPGGTATRTYVYAFEADAPGAAPPGENPDPGKLSATILLASGSTRVVLGQPLPVRAAVSSTSSTGPLGALVYRWQPNPEATFSPVEGASPQASVVFTRPGRVKVWVDVLRRSGEALSTVAASNQIDVEVVAPAITLSATPAQPYPGEEVRVTANITPAASADYLDLRWEHTGAAISPGPLPGMREFTFAPKNTSPIVATVHARARDGGDDAGSKAITITARPYVVTVAGPTLPGPAPQVWDPVKGGLVTVPRGFEVFQRATMRASLSPAPPNPPRYAWTVSPDGCTLSNPIVQEPTLSCSEAGSFVVSVSVQDALGAALGSGSQSVSVARQPGANPPVALSAQSTSGYWKINGTPEVTERYESRSENGWEYKIVSSGSDNVRFNYRDAISGKYIGLAFKWSGPATIVPGEVVPVSVWYEVTGSKYGGFTARLYIPGRNATADFLGIDLLQNSVPTAQVINTKTTAPLQSGDREMRYRATLSGGLAYEVTVQYRWMEGTPPPSSVTPPPGGGPTSAPPPNVVVGADGRLQPAPGYGWVSDQVGDLRVAPRGGTRAGGTGRGDDTSVVKVLGEGSQIPACAQEVVLYTNNNSGGVSSGPTQPTRFTLNAAARISSLLTYHWNDGRGQPPGSISLVHQDGTRYGPWTASGTPGSGGVPNAYWTVRPDVVVQPGIYTVGDSHAASWAQNAQSNSEGIVQVKGCGGR